MVHIIFPNDFDPHENCIYELKKKSVNLNDDIIVGINNFSLLNNKIIDTKQNNSCNPPKKSEESKPETQDDKKSKTFKDSRYHNDPIYRRKYLDKQKEYKKIKYDTDPEYKRKCLDRVAVSIKKKKIKDIEESYKNGLNEGLQSQSNNKS